MNLPAVGPRVARPIQPGAPACVYSRSRPARGMPKSTNTGLDGSSCRNTSSFANGAAVIRLYFTLSRSTLGAKLRSTWSILTLQPFPSISSGSGYGGQSPPQPATEIPEPGSLSIEEPSCATRPLEKTSNFPVSWLEGRKVGVAPGGRAETLG